MGTFDERIRHLEDEVGEGKITAGIVVHQPYAADEHVERHYKHPRGGKSHYIEDPFFASLLYNLRQIAQDVIVPHGSRIQEAMKDIAKGFNDHLAVNAPVDTSTLRRSGNVYVDDNGARVWEDKQSARYRYEKE